MQYASFSPLHLWNKFRDERFSQCNQFHNQNKIIRTYFGQIGACSILIALIKVSPKLFLIYRPFHPDLWAAVFSTWIVLAFFMILFSVIRKRYDLHLESGQPEPDFTNDVYILPNNNKLIRQTTLRLFKPIPFL